MAINLGGAPLNIANGIREFAIASPNQIAIIDGARSITYRELFERACRLANALLAANLKRGVAVGVLMGNRLTLDTACREPAAPAESAYHCRELPDPATCSSGRHARTGTRA